MHSPLLKSMGMYTKSYVPRKPFLSKSWIKFLREKLQGTLRIIAVVFRECCSDARGMPKPGTFSMELQFCLQALPVRTADGTNPGTNITALLSRGARVVADEGSDETPGALSASPATGCPFSSLLRGFAASPGRPRRCCTKPLIMYSAWRSWRMPASFVGLVGCDRAFATSREPEVDYTILPPLSLIMRSDERGGSENRTSLPSAGG
mmetsp:Transcript_84860/g.227516  ORF Transcript_84860/g.227516 Transcript_84860/m.227516 type:complete len:207 (+) Transcript_84860:346-966(+)